MIEELKRLQLTEADFKLLNDGLETLPLQETTNNLMVGMIQSMMAKSKEESNKIREDFIRDT